MQLCASVLTVVLCMCALECGAEGMGEWVTGSDRAWRAGTRIGVAEDSKLHACEPPFTVYVQRSRARLNLKTVY